MSSFYDGTYSLLEWCKENDKSQDELLRIARRRWEQAKFYIQHLKGELPPCESYWTIRKYISKDQNIFQFGDEFLGFLEETALEDLYDTYAFEVLHGLFQTLHSWGHRIANAKIGSDNPYFGIPKDLDSAAWLETEYGSKRPWLRSFSTYREMT